MASRTTRSKATPKKTPPKVKQEETKAEDKTKVEVKEPTKEPEAEKKEVKEEIKEEGKEEVAEETPENGEPEAEEDGNEEEVDEDKLLDGNDEEEEMEEETEVKEGEEETKEGEGEEETKEGEDKEKEGEEEKAEGEEKKEETTTEEDEKKAAEKKAAEKKAAEKKAAEKKAAEEKKNKMYIPTAGKYNQDEHVYMRLRSVVVGPLELEDLQNDIVKDMANKAEEFFYRFHYIEKEEKHVGHIEFRFKSIAEADEMIETLKTIKEGVVVKRLVGGMNAAKFDKDVRGINDEAEKEKYKRIVAVGGVPESATQEKLQEVFPDARVKFIALKPDGTPKWYAYLELDDEKTAKKIAEQYMEVEFEGEKLYCRCLRPGKPEDPEYETNPDHVLTDEERKKVQARINNMKYKLNGGAILRPLDAQRLKRRVNQLSGLLRSSHNRRKDGSKEPGDDGAAKSKTGGPPAKRNDQGPGNRRPAMRGNRGRGGMQGAGLRPNRGGRQGGWQGGSSWQGGPGPSPNRNMGNANFRGNQRAPAIPMGSPRQQGGFYGGRGGSPARSAGGGGGGGGGGRSNMYNNPQQTANAVNMLVGLTNLLSQARNQGGQGGSSQGASGQAAYNQQPGGGNYSGSGSGSNYSGGYDRGENYERGSYGGSGYGGGSSSYGSGSSFNNGGGNYSSGGYSGGGYGGGFSSGGSFGNSGGNFNNRKRTYSGGQMGGQSQARNKRRRSQRGARN